MKTRALILALAGLFGALALANTASACRWRHRGHGCYGGGHAYTSGCYGGGCYGGGGYGGGCYGGAAPVSYAAPSYATPQAGWAPSAQAVQVAPPAPTKVYPQAQR